VSIITEQKVTLKLRSQGFHKLLTRTLSVWQCGAWHRLTAYQPTQMAKTRSKGKGKEVAAPPPQNEPVPEPEQEQKPEPEPARPAKRQRKGTLPTKRTKAEIVVEEPEPPAKPVDEPRDPTPQPPKIQAEVTIPPKAEPEVIPNNEDVEMDDMDDATQQPSADLTRASDLYLDTVNRAALDFDFEKVCSVSLSNINIYGCLVCGKYFQGRGKSSYAYAHSIHEDHHVFINLESQKVQLFDRVRLYVLRIFLARRFMSSPTAIPYQILLSTTSQPSSILPLLPPKSANSPQLPTSKSPLSTFRINPIYQDISD
jgi:hypothetical protein